MITSTISNAKNTLSALLQLVQRGETVVILDRDRPVARLVPIEGGPQESDEAWLAEQERQGLLRRGKASFPAGWRPEPVSPIEGADVVAALLADREESR